MSAQEFIESLSDVELIFLKKYKLKSYLAITQEKILLEYAIRGLEEKENLVLSSVAFNQKNNGCPRCNSQKFEKIVSEKIRYGGSLSLVVMIAKKINKETIHAEKKAVRICQICGFKLGTKKNWIKRLFNRIHNA